MRSWQSLRWFRFRCSSEARWLTRSPPIGGIACSGGPHQPSTRCCTIILPGFVRSKVSCELEEHARFNRASDQLRRATLVVMRVWAIYSPSMSMFEAIGALLILGFGSYAALNGTMQIGDLVAFLMLTAFLYDPVSRLHQLNQLVQAGRAAGERVFEILDEGVEPGVVADAVRKSR